LPSRYALPGRHTLSRRPLAARLARASDLPLSASNGRLRKLGANRLTGTIGLAGATGLCRVTGLTGRTPGCRTGLRLHARLPGIRLPHRARLLTSGRHRTSLAVLGDPSGTP
jgi:hypothetical protein